MKKRGFTLIELLVVVLIIGILAAVVIVQISHVRSDARDSRRKADLKSMQQAVEAYYVKNYSYPSTNGVWCGEPGTTYPVASPAESCLGATRTFSGTNGYIPDLAPEFLSHLPSDPSGIGRKCSSHPEWGAGYMYKTNANADEYKILAFCTPEGSLSASDPFYNSGGTGPGVSWQVSSPNGMSL